MAIPVATFVRCPGRGRCRSRALSLAQAASGATVGPGMCTEIERCKNLAQGFCHDSDTLWTCCP